MLYCCWLLVGQRFLVGVGGGWKRLNIMGAYCPEDQEYLDLRLSRDYINGQQFVNLLRLLRASHPETERFILYWDNAKYYHAEVVREYLALPPGSLRNSRWPFPPTRTWTDRWGSSCRKPPSPRGPRPSEGWGWPCPPWWDLRKGAPQNPPPPWPENSHPPPQPAAWLGPPPPAEP